MSNKQEATFHGGIEHMAPDHNLFRCQHPQCRKDAAGARDQSAWQPYAEGGSIQGLPLEEWVQQALTATANNPKAVEVVGKALTAHVVSVVQAIVREGEARLKIQEKYLRNLLAPEEPSQETICDKHKQEYFESGYKAGRADAAAEARAN